MAQEKIMDRLRI